MTESILYVISSATSPSSSTPVESEQVKFDTESESAQDEKLDSGAIFRAVGIIKGEVSLGNDGKNTITVGNSKYPLICISAKQRRAFDALLKEIENTGNHIQKLVVYPKITHFPKKEIPHQIAFQLVGFEVEQKQLTLSQELQDLEFKISGLWQFIPACPTPCISVFRNFTHQRLEYIKQMEVAKKVKFMKASHLPLLWKDAPVKPFRFNPKAGKEQGHSFFVSVKAKFLPQRNVFSFEALLAPSQQNAPKFLKASQKDKAAAQRAAKEFATNKDREVGSTKSEVVHKDKPKPAPPKIKSASSQNLHSDI